MWKSQAQILKPAVKDLNNYLKYFSPESVCDSNVFAQCLISGNNNQTQTGAAQPDQAILWSQCSTESDCITKWSDIAADKKMKLEQKFGRSA